MSKEWKSPKVEEVVLKEDSTSTGCQMKRIGCYAGSSCGSTQIKEQPQPEQPKSK